MCRACTFTIQRAANSNPPPYSTIVYLREDSLLRSGLIVRARDGWLWQASGSTLIVIRTPPPTCACRVPGVDAWVTLGFGYAPRDLGHSSCSRHYMKPENLRVVLGMNACWYKGLLRGCAACALRRGNVSLSLSLSLTDSRARPAVMGVDFLPRPLWPLFL